MWIEYVNFVNGQLFDDDGFLVHNESIKFDTLQDAIEWSHKNGCVIR